jgi:hypothetical protein
LREKTESEISECKQEIQRLLVDLDEQKTLKNWKADFEAIC